MKYLIFLGLLISPALFLRWLPGDAAAPAVPRPLAAEAPEKTAELAEGLAVLELFTSQGCSSCPPADRVLAEYARAAKDNVIALSFHVDYWNRLGWADPYSSPWFSARQTDYTDRLSSRTYTPQLVVNGRQEMIGSRSKEVAAAVRRGLATPPRVAVKLEALTAEDRALSVKYSLADDWEGLEITGLLVQNYAATDVTRGENRGRALEHHNVVRELKQLPASRHASGEGVLEFELPDDLEKAASAVAILVAEPESGEIVGARLLRMSAR
ncbi:thioredoxin family protein [Lewinella sp. W8]|uniref:DUF1223 domain-containing protein n=1 Tax=Lewinella sp. W8 TaxID=2528208 RepID=UPI00106821CC|nr:DUF1223 domain-containing protein [Lewinella sp. W8]MTB53350.1 DUF1223 domain-containing protein [Lewinella sp. W8]